MIFDMVEVVVQLYDMNDSDLESEPAWDDNRPTAQCNDKACPCIIIHLTWRVEITVIFYDFNIYTISISTLNALIALQSDKRAKIKHLFLGWNTSKNH